MRRQKIAAGLLILLTLVLTAPVYSADNWYAGIQLGPEFLTDDAHGTIDDAVAFGAYGGYRLDRQLALEASLTTASHDVAGSSEINVTSLLFGPRLSAQINRNLNLYGDVGLGIHFIDPEYGSSETESGMYLGCGMEFPVQSNLRLGMDFKYHVIFDEDELDSDIVTLLLRIGF